MSISYNLMADLHRLVKIEQARDAVGRVWSNMPPVTSYAHACGDTEIDPVIKRKKNALRKSWPELAEALDALMDGYIQ